MDDPDIEQVDPDNEEEDEIGTADVTLSSSDNSSNEEGRMIFQLLLILLYSNA